ncbi:hypothetical protein K437DRAFT_268326 [Tilletiaria anomala UBC 951]|uniref:Uncharacterized protein n=1 Tax=Tilletiaria anomala (strain ATCC 24038 / CBS 436.72 / UBC 951) TaxID=1037660 RepID=A0A066W4M0_TILAU|nr:uncharacterized protein K437DRAFT_268326 [Tilletiaria anomala UBC 951]KDN45725.1 hypothetical protein K437DRAFT_268326 [Tilletiaria anomala UBC 951]
MVQKAATSTTSAKMTVPSSIPATQRAIVINKTGGPEVLEYNEQYHTPKLEDLKTNQILIRAKFAGINFIGELRLFYSQYLRSC